MPLSFRSLRSRNRLVGAALALAVAAPALAQVEGISTTPPATTTTTVTTKTAPAPRAARSTAPRTRGKRTNNPKAVPWNPLSDKSPIGNMPPRVTPGRPAGAVSTTPAVSADDPGDTGTSQTSPTTPR